MDTLEPGDGAPLTSPSFPVIPTAERKLREQEVFESIIYANPTSQQNSTATQNKGNGDTGLSVHLRTARPPNYYAETLL